MNRRQFLFTTSAVSLSVLPLVGCGGTQLQRVGPNGRGKVAFTLHWPSLTSRLIPVSSKSVVVQLLSNAAILQQQRVSRGSETTANILFENVPPGTYQIKVAAFPNTDGSGVAQANGSVSVNVVDGQTSMIQLTMASTIQSLQLNNQSITVGASTQLIPTAADEANNLVLIAASALRWTSSDSSLLRVDNSGTIVALSAGDAIVTVTDTESGKSAQAAITIKNPPQVPAVPMFLNNERRTGRSLYSSSASGKLKWKFQTGDFIWASPVIGSDGTIYIASTDGKVYAVNATDGTKKWEVRIQNDSNLVLHSTPAIDSNNALYVGSQSGFVYSLNGATGAQNWAYNVGRQVNSSPLISSDGTLFIGTGDSGDMAAGSVLALDAATGTKKWETPTVFGIESSPSLSADGTLYIGDGQFNGGNVYAINSTNGSIKWTWIAPGGVESSPSISDDGTIYVGTRIDGGLFALDGLTGNQKWSFTAFDVRGCPSIDTKGNLYFPSSDNNIYALNSSGTLIWKFSGSDQFKSTPTIAPDGTLYGGGKDGYLYSLNSQNGNVNWKLDIGNYVFSSPAIDKNGVIYITSFDGCLYAIN